MSLNYSGKNLRGRSFKGQNLTNADFSNADIRGADFTKAILKQASFTSAKAGLGRSRRMLLCLITYLLVCISGAATRFSGGIAADILGRNSALYRQVPGNILQIINLSAVLVILAILLLFIAIRGIKTDLVTLLLAISGVLILSGASAGLLNLAGVSAGMIALDLIMRIAWDLAGTLPWATVGALTGALAGILWLWLSNNVMSQFLAALLVLVGLWGWSWQIVAVFFKAGQPLAISIIVASATSCLAGYMIRRVSFEDPKFAAFRAIAINLFVTGGTRFRNADLTEATLNHALLSSADFSGAKLIRTDFHGAHKLEQAKVEHTILSHSTVRELLVTHQGENRSYQGYNLRGANLAGVNLNKANLTGADLSEATLEGAWLEYANLTEVKALKTNFERARLTGACIEAWNIDSTTQIEDVITNYIYLRNGQQERRPSSGTFAPGDFTELFQEIIHTLDLIFRNGVDQKAFNYSLYQLQVENQGMALPIRSLEKKSNGVVVVRVDVPAEVDKSKLHADFSDHYELALNALAAKYQAKIQAKDEQIEIYRSQLSDWKEVAQSLANRPSHAVNAPQTEAKLVVLHIREGDLNVGFPVSLQIGAESQFRVMQSIEGCLAPAPELFERYAQWRSIYRKCLNASFRLDVPDTQITNFSRQDFFQDCLNAAEQLQQALNQWLNAESFRPIKERLLEQLAPSESIRIVLQTDDRQLRRLPFQRWEFFERYHQAELALSNSDYELIKPVRSVDTEVNILAILGDATGINVQRDRTLLSELPNAKVMFLVEPSLQSLNEQLWTHPWDILFFAGHSSSQIESDTGQLFLNQSDRLTVTQLKYALRRAIAQGLKLAIFNSCDGLGLARELADLHLPYMIVMREPVPDQVAQEFLKHFLSLFSSGESLYQSVRDAREKLQGLEDRFPCATWLPVICQNPSAPPLTWQHLQGG